MEDSKKFSKDICKIVGHDATTEVSGGYCERCEPFPCRIEKALNPFIGDKLTPQLVEHMRSIVFNAMMDAKRDDEIADFKDLKASLEGRYLTIEAQINKDGQWQVVTLRIG